DLTRRPDARCSRCARPNRRNGGVRGGAGSLERAAGV
ncbi:MAG: hypothetical protein AVDCRST_MAG80-1055, partial [uncultured Rubrobacteraceae bacterium]